MAGLVQKFKDMWTPPEDEYEYDYDYEDDEKEEDVMSNRERHFEQQREQQRYAPDSTSGNKVVNLHSSSKLQVVLFKPERFGEETRSVADELLKMHTVVLNLENANSEVSRRIIDFLSGVAYANSGKIKRVATNTFIITPYNVDLTGEDLLDGIETNGVYF